MVNTSLVKYIQEQLKQGYDAQTIRGILLKNGYTLSDVDEAMRDVYSPEVRHVIHFSPATLISIAAIFVGLIAVTFVLFNFSSKTPEMLLDLNLEGVKTTANAGSDITFISEIDNLGSATRYDVSLKYEIINLGTNDILTFKEETRAIETKGSKQINIEIPSDAETGSYVLRAIATYDGQRAVATLPVKIEEGEISEEEEETVIEEEPEEEPEEAIEEEPEDTTEEESDEVTAGIDALTTFETLEKVESIAKQNRREAERLCENLQLQISRDLCFNKLGEVLGDRSFCKKVNDERTKDVCISNVAKIVDKSEICEEISKDSRKDNCYMSFVTGGKKDYTVCVKVINQYLKQSCESLEQLSKLNITDVAFYESLINQSLFEFI